MIHVRACQFPISFDVAANLAYIQAAITAAPGQSLIIFPEGALSGYAEDADFVDAIDQTALASGVQQVRDWAQQHALHVVVGACLFEAGQWFNCAIYCGAQGEFGCYRKVNLAMSERKRLSAGSELVVWPMLIDQQQLIIAPQLCREIRFPEQWQFLARQGAQIFTFLTNAVGDAAQAAVWRSHLISRAAENQRFVLAANAADVAQKCPTMLIAPTGQVLAELTAAAAGTISAQLDLSLVADWYLNQARPECLRLGLA